MHYIVYQVENQNNGKIYIGVHQTANPDDDYMGSGVVLRKAIAKHGMAAFEKTILFDYDDPKEMFAKEVELVDCNFVLRADTYNIKIGGSGGFDYVNKSGRNLYGLNGTAGKGLENLLPGDIIYSRIKAEGREQEFRDKVSHSLKKGYREGTIVGGFSGKKHTPQTRLHLSERKRGTGIGKANSQFGTRWVANPVTGDVRKINGEELDTYLSQGYTCGRKTNVMS